MFAQPFDQTTGRLRPEFPGKGSEFDALPSDLGGAEFRAEGPHTDDLGNRHGGDFPFALNQADRGAPGKEDNGEGRRRGGAKRDV